MRAGIGAVMSFNKNFETVEGVKFETLEQFLDDYLAEHAEDTETVYVENDPFGNECDGLYIGHNYIAWDFQDNLSNFIKKNPAITALHEDYYPEFCKLLDAHLEDSLEQNGFKYALVEFSDACGWYEDDTYTHMAQVNCCPDMAMNYEEFSKWARKLVGTYHEIVNKLEYKSFL